MSTPVTYNGVVYNVPAFNDTGWAQGPGNMSAYLIALASGSLQQTGGLFSLTGQANFGPNFGLTALDFINTDPLPATTGTVRLSKTSIISWRNNTNTTNLNLGINGSDQLTFDGSILSTTTTNGTVNTGTANDVAFYAASTNTVSATTAFTVGSNGPNGIVSGTNTNDIPAAGSVGEVIVSTVIVPINAPASTTYGDITSITLTPGNWMISINMSVYLNTATSVTQVLYGYSTTPGNSTAGLTTGSTRWQGDIPSSTNDSATSMAPRLLRIASGDTYYLKIRVDYSGGQVLVGGEILALRTR